MLFYVMVVFFQASIGYVCHYSPHVRRADLLELGSDDELMEVHASVATMVRVENIERNDSKF